MNNHGDIAANLRAVKERIAAAAERSGREVGDITLVAVSKTVPAERIMEALEAGATDFGENRVQEAREHFNERGVALPGMVPRDNIRLHMIGSLQRNKARAAASFFDYIHSVDRAELLEVLEKDVREARPGLALPVLLQVNVTGESTKSGITPNELPRLAGMLAGCKHLKGTGLMTIARLGAGEKELRQTFSALRKMLETTRRDYPEMRHLSMGMTDDFEIAIEEGATMVRIGRAIFGERLHG